MIYHKICDACRKPFDTDMEYKAFCSVECADKLTRPYDEAWVKSMRKHQRKLADVIEVEIGDGSTITCVDCGRTVRRKSAVHRFCSRACAKHWEKNNDKVHKTTGDEIIKSFQCKECGRSVNVVETSDKREEFCSNSCSRKFHRWHYLRRNGKHQGGMSGGMSLGRLAWREKYILNQ